jgi:hypothetical protein
MLAKPISSWLWLSSPGACAGHALLELVLAMLFWSLCWPCSLLTVMLVSSLAFTNAVVFSGCVCLFKLYDLTVRPDHAGVAITVSSSYGFS